MAVDYATLKRADSCGRNKRITFPSGFVWSAAILPQSSWRRSQRLRKSSVTDTYI